MWPSGPSHDGETARRLYEDAPFGLLAHDTCADPIFTCATTTAQRCSSTPGRSSCGFRPGCPRLREDRATGRGSCDR
ncbi:hypothetical protein P2Q00_02245 [Streptomyces coacervatus]|nr:hypothetical protein [Streptomyces coacervatus]MDF2264260.1 hypothetical protein [Streptomyces coacervatus]